MVQEIIGLEACVVTSTDGVKLLDISWEGKIWYEILKMKTIEAQSLRNKAKSSNPSGKETFLYSEYGKPCLQSVW